MNLSEVLLSGSQYLNAADLPERSELELTIDKIQVEKMGDEKKEEDRETKPVLYFVGKEKGLVHLPA
jgi:hypothetical protein